MNNLSRKKCHNCNCGISYDKGASILLMVVMLAPLFLLNVFKNAIGAVPPFFFVIWIVLGFFLFVKFVPLVVDET
jgi:hypothetical protein